MENVILIIVRALAALGTKGVHFVLEALHQMVLKSNNKVDDELFNQVLADIKTYEPKNA